MGLRKLKIIYCIRATYNPGGMERVLLNKVRYLVERLGWDVSIVTTDQQGRPSFYPFPKQVRMTDLGIDYADDNDKGTLKKICGYLRRRKLHRQRLEKLLRGEKADIVVSLYPSESSFIPLIKDGSKKILELHHCKFFRVQYGRGGLIGLIDRLRTKQDVKIVSRFDRFVVLTHEDKGYWGNLPNIEVIGNAAMRMGRSNADGRTKRVIAVGRLDYQKGFDRLVEAWDMVRKSGRFGDWRLDIFGQGEWREMLQRMIEEKGLGETIQVNAPTNRIGEEYARSSMLVMSSHYEGFPMVMIEAMACGLPVVTFDYKCGPRDIIRHGENGLLVRDGDIKGLADAMMRLMADDSLRKKMGAEARKVTETYSEEKIMARWVEMFRSLVAENPVSGGGDASSSAEKRKD